MRVRPILSVALVALFAALLGCKAPMAAPERDLSAKTFAAVADKAVVYLYRNEFMGAAVKMEVTVDGKSVGKTVAKSYLRLELAPGPHTLVSKAESDSTLQVEAEAGKVYYVWQEVKMGILYARCKLQLMPAEKGQAGVKECQLLEDAPAPAPK